MTTDTPPSATSPDKPALLETMRLEHGIVTRRDRHLHRLQRAASAYDYPWTPAAIDDAVAAACSAHPHGLWRLRLLLDDQGHPTVTCHEHTDSTREWRVAFADRPVDRTDPRLAHKTTDRAPYDRARRSRPDVDDVLLWNEDNEVTESTIANIVVEIDGVTWTPPVSSGLLAGVLRAELLDEGTLREQVLTRGMVARATRLWLINSLRGWIDAVLVR
jgi:para-aminobenzoate synthetase/4-amino-4-deoxychorismate lyase